MAERQVELVVAPGIVEVAGPRLSLRPAAGLSMLHVERPADGLARLTVKKVMDLVLAAIITLLVLPIGLAIAAAIKLTSRGPVFFRQERVGEHGRIFQVIKFRSMVVDAERAPGGDEPRRDRPTRCCSRSATTRGSPPSAASSASTRWTSCLSCSTCWLARCRWSGRGPTSRARSPMYESDAIQRLRVLPGMTGLWQISGRSNLSWEESLRLDLWYVDNWSPMLDLQILIGTARAVLRGSGAY